MAIPDLNSPAVRRLRRRLDVGHVIRALMGSATICGVVLLLVMVDRAEAPDDPFEAPVVTSATAPAAPAAAHPAGVVVAKATQEISGEVRDVWSSDTSSTGTRPDASH